MITEMRDALTLAKRTLIKTGDDNAMMIALPAIDAALALPTEAEIEAILRAILVEEMMKTDYEYTHKFRPESVHRNMIFGRDALAALRRAFGLGQTIPLERA